MDSLLSVKKLKHYFTKNGNCIKAVDDISFDIGKGEVLGLIGESGCGKTTAGRSIIRLYDIDGGDVFFKGKRIGLGIKDRNDQIAQVMKSGNKKLAKKLKDELDNANKEVEEAMDAGIMEKMQMIFQDPISSLNPRMTVREIIAEGLIIRGIKEKTILDKRVKNVLDLVGLAQDHLERYPHEFSGGQKQRIGIARAILLEPDIIIADEPVSALDASIQAQILNLLNDLRENMGLAILFISHDLNVVKYLSNRIAVMYSGKIVEMADNDEIFSKPLHPYTQALIASIPIPNPLYKKRRQIMYTHTIDYDYTQERSIKEVLPGHFVYCSTAEFNKYQSKSRGNDEG